MTAQQAFARMLKEEIAPALRRLGFRGSGQRFELRSETHWAVIGFQKFTWSDQDNVEFTLNLTVVGRDQWARAREERPHLPAKPSGNVFANVGWEGRVADVIPDSSGDVTWAVSEATPAEAVAAEVVGVITDYVLPAFRKHIRDVEPRRD
jgi:hypothetical protein